MKCKCGGELKLKKSFFQRSSKEWHRMSERFRKEFGDKLPIPKGYNCIKCGACYDEEFKREKYNIGWL